ncbi:MAG: hypothetical protein J3K34DRAFT_399631 [Monoraphidium minutum]|nr:MAG: hypothetical protein J3K34DRAFT_399631 [Monoraphidium minutum]
MLPRLTELRVLRLEGPALDERMAELKGALRHLAALTALCSAGSLALLPLSLRELHVSAKTRKLLQPRAPLALGHLTALTRLTAGDASNVLHFFEGDVLPPNLRELVLPPWRGLLAQLPTPAPRTRGLRPLWPLGALASLEIQGCHAFAPRDIARTAAQLTALTRLALGYGPFDTQFREYDADEREFDYGGGGDAGWAPDEPYPLTGSDPLATLAAAWASISAPLEVEIKQAQVSARTLQRAAAARQLRGLVLRDVVLSARAPAALAALQSLTWLELWDVSATNNPAAADLWWRGDPSLGGQLAAAAARLSGLTRLCLDTARAPRVAAASRWKVECFYGPDERALVGLREAPALRHLEICNIASSLAGVLRCCPPQLEHLAVRRWATYSGFDVRHPALQQPELGAGAFPALRSSALPLCGCTISPRCCPGWSGSRCGMSGGMNWRGRLGGWRTGRAVAASPR